MDPEEVFAVNRNAKDPTVGEGTWHYYTAVSGRQCYVESWRYSMDYGADYTRLRYQLEQVSDRIFAQTQAQDAFALARSEGIRYLLVSRPLKPEGFVGAQPIFENNAVLIYEVPQLEEWAVPNRRTLLTSSGFRITSFKNRKAGGQILLSNLSVRFFCNQSRQIR